MSEVSLGAESGKTSAEDPQVDCEKADKVEEGFGEHVKEESIGSSRGRGEEMYDIDIDSAEEDGDKHVQKEDEGFQSEGVVTCGDGLAAHKSSSVDFGGQGTNHHVETAENMDESEDSDNEAKVILLFLSLSSLCSCPCRYWDLYFLWWQPPLYIISL